MKKYALIGENLGYSISPYIHNLIFKHLSIESSYCVIDIPSEDLPELLKKLSAEGFGGVNVTIPHKQNIMPYLSDISDEASRIGAVNTIKIESNSAVGYNTDYYGFGSMMKRAGIEVRGKSIAVLGSGGASRSVIAYLADQGAININVFSKTDTRFADLKAAFPFIECSLLEDSEKIQGQIAINTTPVGMAPNVGKSVINAEIAHRFDALVDIVYNPTETEFIKIGKQLGKITQNGLYMLIDQAVKAQEIFQSISIDPSVGEAIYENILTNKIIS